MNGSSIHKSGKASSLHDRRAARAQAGSKSLKRISNGALLAHLEKLRGRERAILVEILRYLNEVDRRRLYLPLGYGSLFDLCTERFGYSRSSAGRRIRAARCIERFPQAAGMLLEGKVSLCALSMVAGILTNENASKMLESIKGRPFRDVEMLVARHRPEAFLRDRVKPVCIMTERPDDGSMDPEHSVSGGESPTHHTAPADCKANLTCVLNGGIEEIPTNDSGVPADIKSQDEKGIPGAGKDPGGRRCVDADECEHVVITQKYKLEFAVDPEFMRKLARIRSLLSTKHPGGLDFEGLFGILMDEYLDRHGSEGRLERRNRRARKGGPPVKKRTGKKDRGDVLKSAPGAGDECTERPSAMSDCKANLTFTPNVGSEKFPTPGDGVRTDNVIGDHARVAAIGKDRAKGSAKPSSSPRKTRYIPRSVRDEVFERDGGRCTFVGPNGKRCESRWNLHIDHIIPYAKGGRNSPDNLRLLCARHNRLEADRAYGTVHMRKFHKRE